MAKGFGKDGKGVIVYESRSQALGALSGNKGIIVGTKLAITDDFRMLKNELLASVTTMVAGEGHGLEIGIADGDFTLAQIEEALDKNGPLARDNTIETEQAQRAVFILGTINPTDPAAIDATFLDKVTGAPFVISKLRWTFHSNTQGWNYFVYNSGQTLSTGSTVKIHAKSFGLWLE